MMQSISRWNTCVCKDDDDDHDDDDEENDQLGEGRRLNRNRQATYAYLGWLVLWLEMLHLLLDQEVNNIVKTISIFL